MQGCVLIRAEEEELVLNYRAAESAPEPVVIKRRLRGDRPAADGRFRQIIHRVQVSVLRVPLTGAMPIVGAGLCDKNKYPSCGMAIFRAELLRHQHALAHGVRANRAIGTGKAQSAVVNAFTY